MYDLTIPCKGGAVRSVVKTEAPKRPLAACYVRLTTRVSQTND